MIQITTLQNQSLFDIALQVTGDVSGVFLLAIENNISITDHLQVGQVLRYSGAIINKHIRDYYQIKRITPATDCTVPDDGYIRVFSDQFSTEFR